ncbi:MAG TPA: inositol monophosphatase, partial [Synechococcus sp. UBA9887]|nr:inositol monophosphatase [Synechococcus sp. UBA9887]
MTSNLCAQAAEQAGLNQAALRHLADVAREVAELGGAELMRHYGRLSSIENKGRIGDLVTNADLAAEARVLEA